MADPLKQTQMQTDIVTLLKMAIERRASDLILTVGLPPYYVFTANGNPLEYEPLHPTMTRRLMYSMMDEKNSGS